MLPPPFGRLLHSAAPSRRRRRRRPAQEDLLKISEKPKSPVFAKELRSPRGEDAGAACGGVTRQALSGVNPEGDIKKTNKKRIYKQRTIK